MTLSSFFEALMMICFGLAWPISIYKSHVSRTSAGKSLFFLVIILVGYGAGLAHKILADFDFVFYLYLINILMVVIDVGYFFRNRQFDKLRKENTPQPE